MHLKCQPNSNLLVLFAVTNDGREEVLLLAWFWFLESNCVQSRGGLCLRGMRAVLCCVAFVLASIALAHAQIEGGIYVGDLPPMAEPHALEGAMNIPNDKNPVVKPDGETVCDEGVSGVAVNASLQSVMNVYHEPSDGNKISSQAEALALMNEKNQKMPSRKRHTRLSDIWKKETPCECPFNVYQPVCGVDGNTYPTECFANCIGVKVFLKADCKYVRQALKSKILQEKSRRALTPNADEIENSNEPCEGRQDDAPEERRIRCPRRDANSSQPVPYAEVDETEKTENQKLVQTNVENVLTPTQPLIEMREFQGIKVPYFTGDVINPCPRCVGIGFTPVCGGDSKTYPSACFAKCVGVSIASVGECDQK
eukprot:c13683_g1_i1.p1 GENE.c13683_g1_i1~~c13683_g1_i1.p1  ORF type:complete len:368 (+),score=76.26 c13683_g1_i1:637-1740(+)